MRCIFRGCGEGKRNNAGKQRRFVFPWFTWNGRGSKGEPLGGDKELMIVQRDTGNGTRGKKKANVSNIPKNFNRQQKTPRTHIHANCGLQSDRGGATHRPRRRGEFPGPRANEGGKGGVGKQGKKKYPWTGVESNSAGVSVFSKKTERCHGHSGGVQRPEH